ncbi:polyphosphate kinase [Flavobacterium nitrogenifigens]|uniref:Polyphosphate kinase n=2 Tax=Flavobacterium TaxID=237 RepID=A0A7W7IWU3_9FLAO|nr:polyphosphate kinase 1 [Flavobacterium nitrogenifigens]MBB4801612.1 polyphosphate kinase [Flavobacterium nitrogenifigens]MBB6386570.1 polyphosphate kinase [Flavobacterium notoginsengisoli]
MHHHLIPSEMSWLSFNNCILDEAEDLNNAVYDRIKFLAIHSSNLDEFFRVKINKLQKKKTKKNSHLLEDVLKEVNRQQNRFGKIWSYSILTELALNDITYYEYQELLPEHSNEIEYYFKSIILSYIQVVYITLNQPKTYFLNNRSLYFLVKLKDSKGNYNFAYLNIPSDKLDRFKELQSIENRHYIISIDTIIRNCLAFIFPADKIISCNAIKLNRDENYLIEDESTGDLIAKIEAKVEERKRGSATRFLYDSNMDADSFSICKKAFKLYKSEMIKGGSHHNFFDLFKFPNPVKPNLQGKYYPNLPHLPFENTTSIFDVIKKQNQLLHFPYQSYYYVLQFFNQAAINKNVTEIKITLYRISSQSLIANALISAAKNGKKVTVFVEVKARFDEHNNLFWSKEMKNAGIKIIQSLPNLKVHAKAAMITMKDKYGNKKNYGYLSTGNFNESTANIYSDFGFFTAETAYTNDLKKIFTFLKTKKKSAEPKHILAAGFNMKEKLLELIDTEIKNKKAERPASIFLKINGLDEKDIIDKLIEADKAGVEVTLIVRGICTLLPGIKKVSENMKIYRIVDMFLEHSRIYKFANNGQEKIYLSSADMLSRNLNRRIEVAFPLYDEKHIKEINKIIQLQLEDNTKRRTINSEGLNELEIEDNIVSRRAQTEIYNWIAADNRIS